MSFLAAVSTALPLDGVERKPTTGTDLFKNTDCGPPVNPWGDDVPAEEWMDDGDDSLDNVDVESCLEETVKELQPGLFDDDDDKSLIQVDMSVLDGSANDSANVSIDKTVDEGERLSLVTL